MNKTPPRKYRHRRILPLEPLEPRAFLSASITGTVFADVNADGQRNLGEQGLADVTVYLDANSNSQLDVGETTAITSIDDPDTAADEAGAYVFSNLPNASYDVRIVIPSAPPGATLTAPAPNGFLAPPGTSNAAVGDVAPASITLNLTPGQSTTQSVQFTLGTGATFYDKVDVFLLLDDTGSFASLAANLSAQANAIVTSIQSQLPGVSIAFGVGRFEDYGGPLGSALYSETTTGRPFILSLPIVATSTTDFTQAFAAALARTTPGTGGDSPEALIEALYQTASGAGIDGNGNGATTDSGAAGPAATQTSPGSSGDVPAFSSFMPDAANHVLAPSGTLGGAGFRVGALPIILLATEGGTAYRDEGVTNITGAGHTVPLSGFTSDSSRANTPDYNFDGTPDGAGIQQTVTLLNSLGAVVVGLGTNGDANSAPRQLLESLATVTGAFNRTGVAIEAGTTDKLSPGDPLYFRIDPTNAASFAATITTAVVTAAKSSVINVGVVASDPDAHVSNLSPIASLGSPGQSATFNVSFTHDTAAGRRFDLQFINTETQAVIGSIPVVYSQFSQGARSVNFAGQTIADQNFGIGATAPELTTHITGNSLSTTAIPGDTGKLSFAVTNQGNATASGNIDVKIYLSADAALGNDVLLTTIAAKSINLNAGASTNITADIAIPAGTPVGTYRLIVVVDAPSDVNPSGNIVEFSELNNIAVSDTLDVALLFGTLGNRKNVKLTFADADGTVATFSLTGAGFATLTPHDDAPPDITITGNSASTSIKIDVSKTVLGADDRFSLGSVTAGTGSLKAFAAPAVNLRGDFTLAAGMLASLTLADINGSTLAFLGTAGKNTLAISAGRVSDAVLDAPHQVLKSLKLIDWNDTDQRTAPDGIHTLSIGTLTVTGGAGIHGDFGAAVSTDSIKKFSVTGDLIGSHIALLMPASGSKKSLGSFSVTGTMRDSTFTSVASIGALTVGALDGSKILVHVVDVGALPSSLADFTNPATSISSLTVKGIDATPSFTASFVVAAGLGKVSLQQVDPENSGTPHGIAADKISTYSRAGVASLKKLAAAGMPDSSGDYELLIL